MKRSDRSARETYIQALLPERERYLYQHALNKTRVITRSMKPAEKEAYLQSETFRNTLRQLQRRDKIWQGLLRGELVLSGDRAEFERLSGLIERETQEGRKVDLAFLRTVEKSRVTLDKAYEALRIVREGELRRWFDAGLTKRSDSSRPGRKTGWCCGCAPETTGRGCGRRIRNAPWSAGSWSGNFPAGLRPRR